MKEIYVTPSKEWKIVEQSDPEWQAVFGKKHMYFNVVRVKDNFLIFSGGTLKYVYEWLYKRMLISKDEMNYQISLLEKNNETDSN